MTERSVSSSPLGPISTELKRDYPLLWEIVQNYERHHGLIRKGWGQTEMEPLWSEVADVMHELWAARNAKRNADERASD